MDLMGGPEGHKPEEEKPTDYIGLIIGLALLPLVIFFDHIGKLDMGLNLCICLAVNLIAVRFRWNLRKHFWFWGVVVLLVAVELPLVINIPWPHGWVPGAALLPIGLVGFAIAMGAVRAVEKLVVKGAPSDEGE